MKNQFNQISMSHHYLSKAEFERLIPVMATYREVSEGVNYYYEGTISITNDRNFTLNISLFTETIER